MRIYKRSTSAHGLTDMFHFSLQAHLCDNIFSCYTLLLDREPIQAVIVGFNFASIDFTFVEIVISTNVEIKRILLVILALCSMLSCTYYAQNYAGI